MVVVVPDNLVGDGVDIAVDGGILPEADAGQDAVGQDERNEQRQVGEPQAVVPFPDRGPPGGAVGEAR